MTKCFKSAQVSDPLDKLKEVERKIELLADRQRHIKELAQIYLDIEAIRIGMQRDREFARHNMF